MICLKLMSPFAGNKM